MRKRTIAMLVLLAMLFCPPSALAQWQLTLSMDTVPMGSPVDFALNDADKGVYCYTLLKDGKEVFATETEYAFGSYLPREMGTYELKAAPAGQSEGVSAIFTVVEPLVLTCQALPDTIAVGQGAEVRLDATGGTPPYRYAYAVTVDGQVIAEEVSGDYWSWAPQQEGAYTLHMAVVDAQGASTQLRHRLNVTAHEGIGLLPNGGALCGHGGQESWMVCSTEPWTAETTADFLRIDTPSGQPGDSLAVTATSPTDEYRQGSLILVSGQQRLEWPVSQSAGHGVDEEVFLFATEEPIYIDEQNHAAWMNASGSRSFTVGGASDWVISVVGDFIQASGSGDTLTVTVEPSSSAAVRSGLVTLTAPTGCGYLHIYQAPGQPDDTVASLGIQWESIPLYSQFSGQWKEAKYGDSTLEHSGCAIFALSHGLSWLGFAGDAILPQALADKYAFCLRDGGTINSTLVGNAGDDLGFKTRFELYEDRSTIRDRLGKGAVFSFAVVNGHIALVVEASQDGSMMRIIDSAPSATWERIQNAQLYRQEADGSFSPIASLAELEGIRYYPENNAFGAATYWLESSYVARRGVRLIQLRDE